VTSKEPSVDLVVLSISANSCGTKSITRVGVSKTCAVILTSIDFPVAAESLAIEMSDMDEIAVASKVTIIVAFVFVVDASAEVSGAGNVIVEQTDCDDCVSCFCCSSKFESVP